MCTCVGVCVIVCCIASGCGCIYLPVPSSERRVSKLRSSRLVLCKSCSPHSRAESRKNEPGGHQRARRDNEGGDGRQLSHLKEKSAKPTFSHFVCFGFTALSRCRPVSNVVTDRTVRPEQNISTSKKVPIKLVVDIHDLSTGG